MAKQYGCRPSELLKDRKALMFDVAVYTVGVEDKIDEARQAGPLLGLLQGIMSLVG